MNTELINVKLTDLIGKNVKGLTAQVRNIVHIDSGYPPIFRKLKFVKTFTERGKKWVELYWHPQGNSMEPDCGFTGCTLAADCITIQFSKDQFEKL